jgi:hypothetical protein
MTLHSGLRFVVCFLLLIFVGDAMPQKAFYPPQTVPPGCRAIISNIGLAKTNDLRNRAVEHGTDITLYADCFLQELSQPTSKSASAKIGDDLAALTKIAKQSSNKQVGATNSAAGTTSAVSQPLSLLTLASEYGGLTTSTNNGTFTLQSALDQIPSALATDHLVDLCRLGAIEAQCIKEREIEFLHRFSLGATFNTSTSSKTVNAMAVGSAQGSAQQVSLTPHGSESPSLSSMTAKAVILKDKSDVSDPWIKAVSNSTDVTHAAQALASLVAALPDYSKTNYYYAVWMECSQYALEHTGNSSLDPAFVKYYSRLYGILILGQPFECDQPVQSNVNLPKPTAPQPEIDLVGSLQKVRDSLDGYAKQVEQLRLSSSNPVLTFEYDWNRPQNQPTTSSFKLVFSKNVLDAAKKNNTWTVTGNFAVSIYDSEPSPSIPGASRLRDIQAGAEVDKMLPSIPILGQTTLSAAYYFQDQTSPSILKVTPSSPITGITFTGLPSNASEVFTQKGDVHLAQVKWALGTGKNVRFPLAFSYSNRTELIQKPDWRGQFGVSYNFSSLLSSQGSASQ